MRLWRLTEPRRAFCRTEFKSPVDVMGWDFFIWYREITVRFDVYLPYGAFINRGIDVSSHSVETAGYDVAALRASPSKQKRYEPDFLFNEST